MAETTATTRRGFLGTVRRGLALLAAATALPAPPLATGPRTFRLARETDDAGATVVSAYHDGVLTDRVAVPPPPWADAWPPTAQPGVLWAIPPTPCDACGGVHDCYTSGCTPALFVGIGAGGVPDEVRRDPPDGLHVREVGWDGVGRYAVVRLATGGDDA